MSRNGIFLRSEFLDEIGEDANIVLDLPGHEEVQVNGHVVRIDDDPTSAGMGIRFSGLGPDVRRALANFMIQRSYSGL